MNIKLRAEIEFKDNYKLPGWGWVDAPNWLLENFNKLKVKIPFTDMDEDILKQYDLYIESNLTHITLETNVDIRYTYYEKELGVVYNEANDPYKKIVLHEFEVRINDIFIALQIAQPARIDFMEIKLFLDEYEFSPLYYKNLRYPGITWIALDWGNYNKEIIKNMDFAKVWNWLLKQKDFWNEVPEDKMGIFLNYFRYFHYDRSPLAYMWLSMALESILVTNEKFSKSQISGKIKVLFQQFYNESDINKFIEEFYQLRSKMAHGKQRLFRPTILHDAIEAVEKLDKVFFKNGTFAYTAVIFCIQFMINTDRIELEFREEIKYYLLD